MSLIASASSRPLRLSLTLRKDGRNHDVRSVPPERSVAIAETCFITASDLPLEQSIFWWSRDGYYVLRVPVGMELYFYRTYLERVNLKQECFGMLQGDKSYLLVLGLMDDGVLTWGNGAFRIDFEYELYKKNAW